MTDASKLTKFALAIDHKSGYERMFTYYSLQAKDAALAFAEALAKVKQAPEVFCWLVLKRNGHVRKLSKSMYVGDYEKVRRFFVGGSSEETSTDFGGTKWGKVLSSEINA